MNAMISTSLHFRLKGFIRVIFKQKKFKSRVSFLSEEDVFVKIKLPLTRL